MYGRPLSCRYAFALGKFNIKISDAPRLTPGILSSLGVRDVQERKKLLTAWAPSPEAAAALTDDKVRHEDQALGARQTESDDCTAPRTTNLTHLLARPTPPSPADDVDEEQRLMAEPTFDDFHTLSFLRHPGQFCQFPLCSHPCFQDCTKCGRHSCVEHLVGTV